MAREFSRTQRVADYLQRELAVLIQREMRDPRVGMVSITGVDVSRDLGYARVFFTVLGCDSEDEASGVTEALNKAAGFLRSHTSVGRGRHMEDLLRRAADADRELGLRDADGE